MNISITDVRCGLQIALLGCVTSNLRAVTVSMLSKEILLNFYYENKPTVDEVDLSQVVSTEFLSSLRVLVFVGEQQIVLPQSESVPVKDEDLLVYHRYEECFTNKINTLFKDITLTSACVASQIALLGATTNDLRAVSVAFLEKDLTLYFYYEKEPTNVEIELSEVVMKNLISIFEDSMGKVKRFVIPEPEKDSFRNEGSNVYFRYEEYLADD